MSPHPEKLLTVSSFWKGESQISLRVWSLVVNHIPVDSPIPMTIWASQIELSGLPLKEDTKGGRGGSGRSYREEQSDNHQSTLNGILKDQ